MKKRALCYLARVGIQKLVGFLLYGIGAGFALTGAGILYFAYLFLATLLIGWILFRANEETLAERGKITTDAPKWDKIILLLFWLLNYFAVYYFAGTGEGAEHINLLFCLGMALSLFSAWFSTKATLENTFLESTARIQRDRGQRVCTTGPYRVVRHPTYSAAILNCAGLCMIFPYAGVWGCMGICVILMILRTVLEDRMLQQNLDGYRDYAVKTRYRLIPFLW